MTDTGGDPACWADRVCPACGMLDERAAGNRDDTCPHCGDRQEDHLAAAPRPGGPRGRTGSGGHDGTGDDR